MASRKVSLSGKGRYAAGVQRFAGYSLPEFLVVAAIVCLGLTLTLPAMREYLLSRRAASAARALQASLQLARAEAMLRGASNQIAVIPVAGAGLWAQGWTVSVQKQPGPASPLSAVEAATASVSQGSSMLQSVPPFDAINQGQTGRPEPLIYGSGGRWLDAQGRPVANRSIWFYADHSDRYCLIINAAGRVRMSQVRSQEKCSDE